MLGLIKRQAPEFNDKAALKTLFTALVRSKLEYCSQVWAPYYNGAIESIEHIQERFLKFLDRKDTQKDYYQLCCEYNLEPLALRRTLASVQFCFDLLTNRIDCSELLSFLNLHSPSRSLRKKELLKPLIYTTNYAKFEPMNVMNPNFKLISDICEFDMNRNRFKLLCSRILKESFIYSSN